ncbi:hypothetical protein QTJ16_001425 [Diplocarpon rosae]|uniref:Myb-like domain-containing protein n=1 Tax=Diplocarpon rosae TaxID=946125 RepID=A0AAD9T8G1_9HELO|nr:hypothetical protein QTJ16_001425 [Diplocarpon rosae]PBP22326.1 hypothetical protein BUE80_DR006872 [Diplocarpon rosae]
MNDSIMNDESSGSAYEKSSDEQDSSHDEGEQAPASRAGSASIRSRSRGIARGRDSKTRASDQSKPEGGRAISPDREDQNFEDAIEWAANFQPPSVEDIKTPPRGRRAMNSKAHKPARKRKAPKPASEIRVKRLKSFYSNDYREMLNEEIQDAKLRANPNVEMKSSQIGSSVWSEAEKRVFFMSLDRLGRENIRGIGEHIGTKSQNQVQEYISLLHKSIMERKEKKYPLLTPSELPAAVEISDECVALLERAGDAIAAHQELAEEKVEKAKWGDSWLITEDVAQLIEKRRRDAAGEEAMEEVLPAANLLHLRIWLELSRQIFMNPAAPRHEDNWAIIAEPGERPAVRATAFEDFHSLTVSITKRIVSSVLYCTMSRLRARSSKISKYPEITTDDVEAALNILGMKTSSNDFWIGCAKRCSLEIIDDDSIMTHAEVEEALQEELPERARSRSRSVTHHGQARGTSWNENIYSSPSEMDTESTESESEHVYLSGSDEEVMSSPPSSNFPNNPSVPKRRIHSADVEEAAAQAQDAHTEAFDMHASQVEEIRLWNMLDQSAPFGFSAKPVTDQAPRPPKDAMVERENWREYFDYISAWEAMETPVTEEDFIRNRTRRSRLVKGRAAGERGRSHDVQRLVREERRLRLRDDEEDVFAGFETEQGNGGDERPDSDLASGNLDDQSSASEDPITAQLQTEKATASDEQDDFISSEIE